MFKTKSLTVGIERTINLGNYENSRYSVSTTVDIPEDTPEDKLDAIYADRLAWAKSKIQVELDRLLGPNKPQRLG